MTERPTPAAPTDGPAFVVLRGGTPPPAMLAAIAVALARAVEAVAPTVADPGPMRRAPWRSAALLEGVRGARVRSRAGLVAAASAPTVAGSTRT